MHPTKGLIPVPKGDKLLSANFKSMMETYETNQQNILSLSEYGITYYGVHRHDMDAMCIYYEQMGNCIRQCLPIPSLKRPVLEEKDGTLISKFHVRKASDSSVNWHRYRYAGDLEEMNLEKLRSTIGESVKIVKPEMDLNNYEFKTTQTDDKKTLVSNQNGNVQCLSGLNFLGKDII